MKRLSLILLLFTIGVNAQKAYIEKDITGQQYKLLSIVKQNEAFEKLVIPEKLNWVNDETGYVYSEYQWLENTVRIYTDNHIEIINNDSKFSWLTNLYFEGGRLYGYRILKVLENGDSQLWYFDGKKQVYNKNVKNGK